MTLASPQSAYTAGNIINSLPQGDSRQWTPEVSTYSVPSLIPGQGQYHLSSLSLPLSATLPTVPVASLHLGGQQGLQGIPVTVSNLVSSLQTPLPQTSFLSQQVPTTGAPLPPVTTLPSPISLPSLPLGEIPPSPPSLHPPPLLFTPPIPPPPPPAPRASQHRAAPDQPRQPGARARQPPPLGPGLPHTQLRALQQPAPVVTSKPRPAAPPARKLRVGGPVRAVDGRNLAHSWQLESKQGNVY